MLLCLAFAWMRKEVNNVTGQKRRNAQSIRYRASVDLGKEGKKINPQM